MSDTSNCCSASAYEININNKDCVKNKEGVAYNSNNNYNNVSCGSNSNNNYNDDKIINSCDKDNTKGYIVNETGDFSNNHIINKSPSFVNKQASSSYVSSFNGNIIDNSSTHSSIVTEADVYRLINQVKYCLYYYNLLVLYQPIVPGRCSFVKFCYTIIL